MCAKNAYYPPIGAREMYLSESPDTERIVLEKMKYSKPFLHNRPKQVNSVRYTKRQTFKYTKLNKKELDQQALKDVAFG